MGRTVCLLAIIGMATSTADAQLFPAVTRARTVCRLPQGVEWSAETWNPAVHLLSSSGVALGTSEERQSFRMRTRRVESEAVELRDVTVTLDADGYWVFDGVVEHRSAWSAGADSRQSSTKMNEFVQIVIRPVLTEEIQQTETGEIAAGGSVVAIPVTKTVALRRGTQQQLHARGQHPLLREQYSLVRRVQVDLCTRR